MLAGEGEEGEEGVSGEADADDTRDDVTPAAAKPPISQRLADELATMKTEILALHVAGEARFAADLGTFIMVEAALRPCGGGAISSDLRAPAPAPRVPGFESGSLAASRWLELEAALDRSWSEHDTLEARYDAFCGLAGDARGAWLAWAVARTLHAVPAPRSGSGFLGHLGAKLGIDVAAWWRPQARSYFDRITRPMILELLEEIGGSELRARYSGSRKPELAASAEKLFAGESVAEADVKRRALAWLPPEMRFAPEQVAAGTVSQACDDGPPPWRVEEPGASLQQAA